MTGRSLRGGLWLSTARRALLDAAWDGADPDQLVSAARDARERAWPQSSSHPASLSICPTTSARYRGRGRRPFESYRVAWPDVPVGR
jgi:hypothetical protein